MSLTDVLPAFFLPTIVYFFADHVEIDTETNRRGVTNGAWETTIKRPLLGVRAFGDILVPAISLKFLGRFRSAISISPRSLWVPGRAQVPPRINVAALSNTQTSLSSSWRSDRPS